MQAYHRGMTYPKYLFISYYQNSEFWWTDPIRNVSAYPPPECTALELTFAIYRSLAIDYFPVPSPAEENAPTDVGYVSVCMCIYGKVLHYTTAVYNNILVNTMASKSVYMYIYPDQLVTCNDIWLHAC